VLRPGAGVTGTGSPAIARLTLAAGMASLLDSAAIITVGAALPLWRTGLGLDDWSVGAISSSFTLFIAVGALLGGRAADRLGRARIFAGTVALYAAGAVVLATAQSSSVVVLGVVVLGVASGADLPSSIALVAERAPARVRGRMVARTQVMWTIGVLLATALALAVSPYGLSGIRVAFATLAVAALGTLVVRRRVMRTVRVPVGAVAPDRPPSDGSAAGHGGSRRLLALVAVFYLVFTLVSNTFGSFRTYFLVVVGGAGQTTATAIAFAVTVVGLVGTLIFSVIADGPWRPRVFPAGAALFVGAQLVLALSGGEPLLVALVAFTMYALAYPFVGEGLYKVWSQELVAPDLRATFQGATIALARTAAAGFALVTPALMSWSPAGLFWFLTGAAVVASAVGWVITRATTT